MGERIKGEQANVAKAKGAPAERKLLRGRPYSLRGTLLWTYFVAVIICFGVGFYNFLSAQMMLGEMSSLVEASQRLSAVQATLKDFQGDIDDYLFSRSSLALQSYYDHHNELQATAESLRGTASYTAGGVKYKNLGNFILYYLDNTEEIIAAKRNEKTMEYVALYEEVSGDYQLINQYIQSILTADLQERGLQYQEMQASIDFHIRVSYSLFGVSIVFVVVLVVNLSNNVSRPITRLAGYASQVAEGEYGIAIDKGDSSLELSHLYDAFEVMVSSTRLYLDSLKERRELENELAQQKIKGLETDNLLQQAQLQALHAQMNPHFIFNTINIGARLAMIEGDDVVCDYLENAAEVFRYNLEGLSEATLADELDNVDAYMHLLTIRFGDKLRFRMQVDGDVDLRRYLLPRMTLQPLVENAFVHGVGPCEEGGSITVAVRGNGDCAVVEIANTGREFPREKIRPLYAMMGDATQGHLSGIGLANVIKRLQLQFHMDRPLEIESAGGETKVTLMIPETGGENERGDGQ